MEERGEHRLLRGRGEPGWLRRSEGFYIVRDFQQL
jgi:hypothetical protein